MLSSFNITTRSQDDNTRFVIPMIIGSAAIITVTLTTMFGIWLRCLRAIDPFGKDGDVEEGEEFEMAKVGEKQDREKVEDEGYQDN